MDIQKVEYNADLRIKFASINENGGWNYDAIQEYTQFFDEFPNDWVYSENTSQIETRFDFQRRAWVLTHSDSKTEIAVVEHESGIEFLIAVGIGLSTEAIISLVKWGWKKWNTSRETLGKKLEPSLILENVTSRRPDGQILTVERMEFRAPLADNDVEKHVKGALSQLSFHFEQ